MAYAMEDKACCEIEITLKQRVQALEQQLEHLGLLVDNLIARLYKVDGEHPKV